MKKVSSVKAAQESIREKTAWFVVAYSLSKNEFWETKKEDKEKFNLAVLI